MKKQKQIKNKRKIPWKIVSVILLLLAILGLIIGFSVDWSRPSWIFISGSSTMQPLLQAISNNYKPSEITADAGGSSVGITNVLNNKKNIGAASKTPSLSMAGAPANGDQPAIEGSNSQQWESEDLKTVTIGWDGIGVVYKKVGPLAGDAKVVLNPETVRWLYLAFAGFMNVDATNLLANNNQSTKKFIDATEGSSPTENAIVPFARSGGTQQSGTAEAFTADSRLLKSEDGKYDSKGILKNISPHSTNPISEQPSSSSPSLYSEEEDANIWTVLESGKYGPLTHTTAESNLQTWNSIQSYNGKGIPFTYLSAGFIKNNYDEIQKAGFGVAYYQENTNSQLVELITKGPNNTWSNSNVSQTYMWFRPLNLILKANSASYIQTFIEWLIGNSLFEKSEYRKVLDEQGFIPLTQQQIDSMFNPNNPKNTTIVDEIATYAKQNPNKKYADFVKEKGESYVTDAWKPFWTNSSDYQLLETDEYNDRMTQQVYYGALPKRTNGNNNNNSGK